MRLGGPTHGIVTKTVHKTLRGGGWGEGVVAWGCGDAGWELGGGVSRRWWHNGGGPGGGGV